jgi:hypothetical protein
MTRGWWRIVDPEQVKNYVESLHPRGVREKELSRKLTRFMDFARESCLKVIHFKFESSFLTVSFLIASFNPPSRLAPFFKRK